LEALKLASGNWRGARTGGEAFKFVAGLLTPHRLISWRRGRSRERAGARYGSLPI
jgi:hypothetical protein